MYIISGSHERSKGRAFMEKGKLNANSKKYRINSSTMEILNPKGYSPPVELVPLSPRIPDLNGKVLYLIDSGIFEAHIFMHRIADLLPEYFPGVKVVYKRKPSVYSSDDPELWDEVLKRANAFVYGPAGGTSGFTWGAYWALSLERKGIPGVYIASEGYEKAVEMTCARGGMPHLRRVVTPMPPWSREVLDRQMPGITKDIMRQLTEPLNKKERETGSTAAENPPRIGARGNLDEIQDYVRQNSWSDGLPVIPPTEERVARFLKGTKHSPGEIVTESMPPNGWTVTVEKVAINGVMAGCKPEDMPILLAILEAFSIGKFRSSVVSANSFCFMVVVNGPVAKEIGMNSGINALGPGCVANATIGRALRLILTNLGGLTPGTNLVACQGNPANYSFSFGENEMASPWEPFHVSMGYKREESVVTIFAGGWGHGGNMTGKGEEPVELNRVIEVIKTFQLPWGAVVLLSPPLARRIAKERQFNKQAFQEHLWEKATKPAKDFREDPYYSTFIEPVLKGGEIYGMRSVWPARYLEAEASELIPVYGRSEFIRPIVVGGENYEAFQAWKMAFPSTVSVDRWR
jgi:hypothetical protein